MTKYYFTMVSDYQWEMSNGYHPHWRTADSLTDALIKGRDLFNRMSPDDKPYTLVRIQTKEEFHTGDKIPAYLIGDIYYNNRKFYFCKYIARSFNAKNYREDFLLSKDGKLKHMDW